MIFKRNLLLLLATVFAIGVKHSSWAQSQDSSFLQSAIQHLKASTLTEQSALLNGREYHNLSFDPKFSHPFFETHFLENGNIVFDGITYSNVPLLYDLVQDQVVTLHINSPSYINLVREKVDQFTLRGHTYIYISDDDSADVKNLPVGFYEKIYSGDNMLLLKREKLAKTTGSGYNVRVKFKQIDKFYLSKENSYYQVSDKSAIFKILKDKESELKQFYTTNQLNFKKDPQGTLLRILTYYFQLKG